MTRSAHTTMVEANEKDTLTSFESGFFIRSVFLSTDRLFDCCLKKLTSEKPQSLRHSGSLFAHEALYPVSESCPGVRGGEGEVSVTWSTWTSSAIPWNSSASPRAW